MIDQFLTDLTARRLAGTGDRDAWLAARRQGIGGSDAAAVLGWSPWTSPWSLWLDKAGIVTDQPASEAMEWGNRLEALVADAYTERSGHTLADPDGVYRHPVHEWMLASPDRLIVDPDGGAPGYLEIKTTSGFQADEWADDTVPDHYLVQWQHVAEVVGVTWGAFAVLLGGNRLLVRQMERDDEFVAMLVDAERQFWHAHVVAGTPPPMDGQQTTTELLARLFSDAEPDSHVDLDPQLAQAVVDYRQAHELESEAKQAKSQAGNRLREALGQAEAGLFAGTPVVTWKTTAVRRFDQQAHQAQAPDCHAKFTTTTTTRTLRPGGSKDALDALSTADREDR